MLNKKVLKILSVGLCIGFFINNSVFAEPGPKEREIREILSEIGITTIENLGGAAVVSGVIAGSLGTKYGVSLLIAGLNVSIPLINVIRDLGGRIYNYLSRKSDVSRKTFVDDPESTLKLLHNNLEHIIVGQETAKKIIEQKISSFLEGRLLPNSSKGTCVLYLYGDSGVGKSETANVISKSLCGVSDPLVINPSMLKIDHSKDAKSPIEQFFGNETVYGIAGEKIQYPTKMAQQISTNPKTVLLIEEIDKMRMYDPTGSIDEFLRQILDRGYVVVEGRKLCFRDTIVVITSNESRSSLVKGCTSEGTAEFRTQVDHDFSLLNRLTLVEFGPLSKEEYIKIALPQISTLISYYFKTYGINIELCENFFDLLGEKCCQGHKGARCIHKYTDQIKSLMVEYRISKNDSGSSYKGSNIKLKFDDSLDFIVIDEI